MSTDDAIFALMLLKATGDWWTPAAVSTVASMTEDVRYPIAGVHAVLLKVRPLISQAICQTTSVHHQQRRGLRVTLPAP